MSCPRTQHSNSRPVIEPWLLDPESNALTIRPAVSPTSCWHSYLKYASESHLVSNDKIFDSFHDKLRSCIHHPRKHGTEKWVKIHWLTRLNLIKCLASEGRINLVKRDKETQSTVYDMGVLKWGFPARESARIILMVTFPQPCAVFKTHLYVFCPPPPDWRGPIVNLVNALGEK